VKNLYLLDFLPANAYTSSLRSHITLADEIHLRRTNLHVPIQLALLNQLPYPRILKVIVNKFTPRGRGNTFDAYFKILGRVGLVINALNELSCKQLQCSDQFHLLLLVMPKLENLRYII